MSRCPNCGQRTARTEDWACQWCGYPLLSGAYKKLPKTYKQLQAEKLHEPLVMEEAEASLPLDQSPLPPIDMAEPEPAPAPETKPIEEPEPELAVELESELELAPEPEPELTPAAIEVTVNELLSAYEADEVAADAKFTNEILNVTGVAARIEINEVLDVHYIILASGDQKLLQTIRCVFDKKREPELRKLARGQTVTVQGKYTGTVIDMRMKDCIIVSYSPAGEPVSEINELT